MEAATQGDSEQKVHERQCEAQEVDQTPSVC
jgi:hypothetical protein